MEAEDTSRVPCPRGNIPRHKRGRHSGCMSVRLHEPVLVRQAVCITPSVLSDAKLQFDRTKTVPTESGEGSDLAKARANVDQPLHPVAQ